MKMQIGAFFLAVVVGCLSAIGDTRYVSLTGGNQSPYTSWAQAATSIQPAIDASVDGDVILVSNGIYNISAEISVNKAVIITSVAGAASTTIRGNGSCRGFRLYDVNCVICGFTVTNGWGDGGAFYAHSSTPQICDCILIGNRANYGAAGWLGTLRRCRILNNSSVQAGAVTYAILYDCLVANNKGSQNDAGLVDGAAINCTIVGNIGGGVRGSSVLNSIVISNTVYNFSNCNITNSCGTSLPAGPGNIAADPRFVDYAKGDFRLDSNSPCINAGMNMPWMYDATDLDGNRRVVCA
jgi:hypothetical protein